MLTVCLPFPIQVKNGSSSSGKSPERRRAPPQVNFDDLDLEPVAEAGELCQDLLSKMLARLPERRLTIEEVLSHPFFADI